MPRTLPLLLTAALGASACAVEGDLGEIDLSLVGRAASGTAYRLRDADLTLGGPGGPRVFRTEDDPGRMAITTRLPAGAHTLDLAPGWRLERLQADGSARTVSATLATPNPLGFDVVAGGVTAVQLRFATSGEVIEMGEGDVDISIGVDELPDAGAIDAAPAEVVLGWPTFAGATTTVPMFQVALHAIEVAAPTTIDTLQVIAPEGGMARMAIYGSFDNLPGQVLVSTSPFSLVAGGQPTVRTIPPTALQPGRHWIAVVLDHAPPVGFLPEATPVPRCTYVMGFFSLFPTASSGWSCADAAPIAVAASGLR